MAEPATTAVTAASASATVLLVSALGPTAGPWAVIIAASLAGAMWPVSGTRTRTDREALMLMLRCALLAIFGTGAIASYLESRYGLPLSEGLGIVSLAIGALGNGWSAFFSGFAALMGGAADVIFSRRNGSGK